MQQVCCTSFLTLLLLGIFLVPAGCAQPVDEAAPAAARALQAGDYDRARVLYTELLDGTTTPAHVDALYETYLATGAYAEGLADVDARLAQSPGEGHLHHARGRLLAATGRLEEAEAAYREAARLVRNYWRNAFDLGELLEQRGRRRQAFSLYMPIYQQYQQGGFRTADDLGVAAAAAAKLEEFHDANGAYDTAAQIDPRHVINLYGWAELFRAKYNDEDALRTYKEALAVNPHYADLYVGMAHAERGFGAKEQLAQTALEKNPNHVAARALLAELRILDGLYDEAEALLDEALRINPASIPALSHQAAIHHLRGDSTAFNAVEAQVLALNPRAAAFYITLAEDLSNRFRYPDAVTFARQATQVDNTDVKAFTALGMSLMRVGQSFEARRYLEASYDRDPFNLFVGNVLELLDTYQDFDLIESPHFKLLIHRDETDVLGQAILDEAEACYAALSARYPYTPADKMLIEAYNDAGDFGVRIAGIPHLNLLGVSFGDVIAINTPKAQSGSPYNWARTLWHELAHTMAIGVTRHQVPRWFTEGLSVYEEQRAQPAWGREMDLEFFSAFDAGQLLPLASIDRGFTRPQFRGQIILSYYHAYQVIAFIEAQHGFAGVVGILEGLGQGLSIEASIAAALGQDIDQLDRAFRAHLQERRARYAALLTDVPEMIGDGEEQLDPLEKLDARSNNPFFSALQAGHDALSRLDHAAAEGHFEEAIGLYPAYVGPGNAYLALAGIYKTRTDAVRQQAMLEQYLAYAEHGAEAARELAGLYQAAGRTNDAIAYLKRSLHVEPYDLTAQMRLAELFEGQHRFAEAVPHRRSVLALKPVDRAAALYELAASLFGAGRLDEAKRAVLQSLEIAPGFRDAQKLLLQCVDANP